MSDLTDLYQEMILDHGKRPRNHRVLEDADCSAEGFNPLCGDRVRVYIKMDDGTVKEVTFTGSGCAICTASASLMTQHVKGKGRQEVSQDFERFHHLLTEDDAGDGAADPALGRLVVLAGVRKYPMRVKCATLPWHTMKAALEQEEEVVSTE